MRSTERSRSEERRERRRSQFTPVWFEMAALLIVIGLIVRERAIFALAAGILTVIPVAWLWREVSLQRVEYERSLDKRRAFPGERVEMTVRITNRKLVPLSWLEVSDEIPMTLPLVDGALMPTHIPDIGSLENALSLRWYERVTRAYELTCKARGVHNLGRVRLRSGDPFTLFEECEERDSHDRLVVFPQIWPMENLGLPSKDPFGEQKAHRRLIEDPLRTVGVRDHRPEDGMRRIHWKATAHKGELQVRVYEPTTTLDLVVLLNVTTFEHHWQGVLPDIFERTISVAGSVATWAIGQKYKVGLVANGCLMRSDQPPRVPPGRSPDQLAAILEMLAGVTPFATASIERVLRRESPRLPWGATLVVVTAIVTDPLAETLINLRKAGRRLALVSLEEDPPPFLEGVVTYHLPPSTRIFQRFDRHPYDPTEALDAAGLTLHLLPHRQSVHT
ncbi:MAG: DUF58 domain-containing protein [Chloroflexota bacterium]|nr:DUF58 domain-containing protein [Chloroflexota bacterium]